MAKGLEKSNLKITKHKKHKKQANFSGCVQLNLGKC